MSFVDTHTKHGAIWGYETRNSWTEPMIELETWTSDKGKQELHHFLAADPQTYVYGVNAQLLGPQACELIRNIVTGRLLELQDGGFRVHGPEKVNNKPTTLTDCEKFIVEKCGGTVD